MGIRLRLRREGVDPPLVDDALARLAEEEPDLDWSALVRYARRRRFGRFRTREPVGRDAERVVRRKETAAMARAGFSYALITRFFTTTGDSDEE
jgi:SOS response regulatory protein OraA/RecX